MSTEIQVPEVAVRATDDLDQLFDLLTHPIRRATLLYLETAHGPVSLADLATDLADGGTLSNSSVVADADPETLRLELHHWHVPKLAEAGVVTYNHERRVVGLAGPIEA